MIRKIGETFELEDITYRVDQAPIDYPYCCKLCAFNTPKFICCGTLRVSGDCRPAYRNDCQVIFVVEKSTK